MHGINPYFLRHVWRYCPSTNITVGLGNLMDDYRISAGTSLSNFEGMTKESGKFDKVSNQRRNCCQKRRFLFKSFRSRNEMKANRTNLRKLQSLDYVLELQNTVRKQKCLIRYLRFRLNKFEQSAKRYGIEKETEASCTTRSDIHNNIARTKASEITLDDPLNEKLGILKSHSENSANNLLSEKTNHEVLDEVSKQTSEVQPNPNCSNEAVLKDGENVDKKTRSNKLPCSDAVTFNENNLQIEILESDTLDMVSNTFSQEIDDGEETDEELKKRIEDFMCREDVSTVDVSMKYLICGGKTTRFRRHFLSVLYKQFCAEVYSKCTYSQFCKCIPKNVIKPNPTFWKIILCSRCENAELKFMEVVTKILLREDIFLEEVLVKPDLFEHVSQELSKLKDSQEPFTYMTWAKTLLGKMEANENIVTTTVGNACTDLLKELDLLKEHINRCYNQYEAVREAREETEISPIHALVHIDWYESPATFVARHLHTSYYYGDGFKTLHAGFVRTKEKSFGFASLSDCRNHTAPAVWASINDILVSLAKEGMKVITIVSDSATAQYRNKGNFYLMRRFAKQNNVEMKWIYLEGGHGKGIADSIGTKIKDLMCDAIVQHKEKSFRNTNDILPVIKDLTPIKLFSHSDNLVQQYKNLLSRQHLQVIPSTYKIHEVCVKETTFYVKESSADKLPFFSL